MKKLLTTKTGAFLLLCAFLHTAISVPAQQAAASDFNDRIRREAMENSQIMRTIHFFSDVYGPRLTGSPNHKAAADWAVKQMLSWGFDAARLEAWNFGHPGWVNERAAGFITAPVQDSLVFEVLAWTPGTKGAIAGQSFQINLPPRPTQPELTNYFESVKINLRGKMVLVGKPAVVPVDFEPPPKRIDDADVQRRFTSSPASAPIPEPSPTPPKPGQLSNGQIGEQLDDFLLKSGVSVRINDAGREHGQIRAFNNRSFDVSKTVPTVVLRNEDYGRISRLLADGMPVSLEFDIRNRSIPEGATSYNVVGEISGTDKKDEVIMLGGHLDSWHAATGATDNAVGCAIMMEAARILKASGARPRRTIRVALWSGEEQGLLGSQAYVKEHFGSFENPKPEYAKFGGYFNIDSGTGRARGMSVFGPAEAAAILREAVAPFAEYGIAGAINGRSRGLGGSDHTSFNQAGLPGIGVLQDPIEYRTHTWHTNLDTYERIVEDDVKKSAAVIAAAVYRLAMRDELLPRFKPDEMPAPSPLPTATPRPSSTVNSKK
ncbi:MAG TPA: M20/M25/M40 family metallo-hydrolase [Pyrinomonadaceae bacterium]|nr:M20/M25/M40 family metallo-hydrolase [Pyrinomonadaceae bacterium]